MYIFSCRIRHCKSIDAKKENMFTNYCQAKNIEKASLIDQQGFFI